MSLLGRITGPAVLKGLDVEITEQHAVTSATGLALGARFAQVLAAGVDTCAATFALPPRFPPSAFRDQILQARGLDAAGIAAAVLNGSPSTHRGRSRQGEPRR